MRLKRFIKKFLDDGSVRVLVVDAQFGEGGGICYDGLVSDIFIQPNANQMFRSLVSYVMPLSHYKLLISVRTKRRDISKSNSKEK